MDFESNLDATLSEGLIDAHLRFNLLVALCT